MQETNALCKNYCTLPTPNAWMECETQKREFFGRRKGRLFSSKKINMTEALAPYNLGRWLQNWPLHWPNNVWLEIGFGHGERMLEWLNLNPGASIVGVEVFEDGLIKAIDSLKSQNQERCALVPVPIHRIWPFLPDSSIQGIFLFFPDPWPKARHKKRRLVQSEFLSQCARVLCPGTFIHFASDHEDLINHVLQCLGMHPEFSWHQGLQRPGTPVSMWDPWPPHWPQTRYGQKAVNKGASCGWSIWKKT